MSGEDSTKTFERRASLKLGSGALILGSVVVLVARIAHGDLPTDTGLAALRYVASYPPYALIHLSDWVGVAIWTGGVVALAGSLTSPSARALGRVAAASGLLGAAVHILEVSADGYALPTLASTWSVAGAADRAALESGARMALVILGGPSTSALVIMWGAALAFLGPAVKRDGYSGWLQWTGLGVAAIVTVLGLIQFVKPNDVFPGAIFYGGGTVLSQLWTLALGVAMWQRR